MAYFIFQTSTTGTTDMEQENLTSQINGSNDTFTVSVNFDSTSLRVYYNGIRQTNDFFSTISNNQFQLTFSPATGDKLEIDYIPS
tara:strand:+ start:134 stop:388 length:255 start_codon:yes stop_codon:yes gene_type:complete